MKNKLFKFFTLTLSKLSKINYTTVKISLIHKKYHTKKNKV